MRAAGTTQICVANFPGGEKNARLMKNRPLSAFAGTFALLLALFFAPALSAASERDGNAAEAAAAWEKAFPDGLIKAGQKASAAKKANLRALEGKFVGVYHARSTCSGCRKFTPQLVDFYRKNKGDIEIVLLQADKTEEEAVAYAKEAKMKWLAVPFGGSAKLDRGIEIPGMAVYAPDGTFFMSVYCLKPYRSDQLTLENLRERMDAFETEKKAAAAPKTAPAKSGKNNKKSRARGKKAPRTER